MNYTKCSKCGLEKENSLFSKVSKGRISYKCKECSNAYYREWRIKNRKMAIKGEIKSFETYYKTLNGRAVHMLQNAKQRANKKNLEYNLDKEWLIEKLKVGKCEVTGIDLILQINGGKGHKTNSFSPSLERKDNNKGYTKDNVELTCWIYNRAKGAFPIEDLLTMLKALETKQIES